MLDIKLNAIAAMCDENQGIGLDNKLPWSISEDAEYFLKVVKTTKDNSKINAVIVGTNTWRSLSVEERPISPCLNIIISNKETIESLEFSKNADPNKIIICKSIEQALSEVREKYSSKVETVYAIGGTRIYKESMESNCFNRFYLTRIFGNFVCDAFIEPNNFLSKFKKVNSENLENEQNMFSIRYNRIKTDPISGHKFIFEVYDKN